MLSTAFFWRQYLTLEQSGASTELHIHAMRLTTLRPLPRRLEVTDAVAASFEL